MGTSLGLVGDLDDVELIQDVEAAFSVRFDDNDLSRCWTVGDLFTLIERDLPADKTTGRCATAMCFYRLRRAIQPWVEPPLKPNTRIDALRGLPVHRLYRLIEIECGLRAPAKVISIWGCLAAMLILVGPFVAYRVGVVGLLTPAFAIPLFIAFRLAPVRLPRDIATFGDLVRAVAARNIGMLAKQGARLGRQDAWSAFREVLAEHTALSKNAIGLETTLLAKSPRAAS